MMTLASIGRNATGSLRGSRTEGAGVGAGVGAGRRAGLLRGEPGRCVEGGEQKRGQDESAHGSPFDEAEPRVDDGPGRALSRTFHIVTGPSITSRTLRASTSGVKGLERKAVPGARMPCWLMAASVYPDM